MAGFMNRLEGLLSGENTLGNLGIGLLAASGPSTQPVGLGQILGSAAQFASDRQQQAHANQIMRDQLSQRKKQQGAQEKLSGLLSSGETVDQQQMLGLLAQADPQAFTQQMQSGLLGQMFAKPQKPTGTEAKLSAVEGRLGRSLTDEEVLKLSGGGTTINVGGESKLDEVIPISSIADVRMPNGDAVPIGTTFREARQAGAQVMSGDEQKKSAQADAALGILNELELLALGPDGVFSNVEPGFVNRAGAAAQFVLDDLTQDDPKSSQYSDLSKSTLAPLVKLMGETGALATEDVNRALGLLPKIFPLPDTGDVAVDKMRIVREIIERGVRKSNSGQVVQLGGGVTLEYLDE